MTEQTSRELGYREVTSGLQFPEGPIAMTDGSVVLVEIARGTLSRVNVASGAIEVVADCGGGPNGAALGPDGHVYVCNNGGYFEWHTTDGITIPGPNTGGHAGGSIQRIDVATGEVDTVYTSCDGQPLVAPNDLVFDDAGGMWFTDHGVQRGEHADRPGLLYAKADGSRIEGKAYGTDSTNGVGLSPRGDRVYVSETISGTVWEWPVARPGVLALTDPPIDSGSHSGGTLLFDAPPGNLFDSLAVDGEGWVCVATIGQGGITCVAPDGSAAEHVPLPDPLITNVCFGGPGHGSDDYRVAYATASSSGKLFELVWPRPGLQLLRRR
ncbi:MAG: SMP-30/gluconolactonase/LRE family protein [Actinobacteria bacterium]|nr:SMP-30/gluconolactonase/LRE family protein [Actinomycetota bacterium]